MKFLRARFGSRSDKDKTSPADVGTERVFADAPAADPEPVAAELEPTPAEPVLAGWHGTQPFAVGYATHVGRVRDRNEDSLVAMSLALLGDATDLALGLFVVADGMGGHSEGEKASQLATRIVAKEVMARLFGPFLYSDNSDAPGPVLAALSEAVQVANWRVNRANTESGTTLTAGLVVANRLYLAHVGDSRAYLISGEGNDCELVTLDHSFVRRLQDSGKISAEEALVHPQRNILYRAVGQGDRLEIDTFSRIVPRPGWLLLCSDGLWGVVDRPAMVDAVARLGDPQQICDWLVSAALDAGAPDNISVVAVRFDILSPEAPVVDAA